jgi:hypothetical protein
MRRFVLGFVLLAILTGCDEAQTARATITAVTASAQSLATISVRSTATSSSIATRTAAQATVNNQIETGLREAQRKWQAAGVANYRIVAEYDIPFGIPPSSSYTTTVIADTATTQPNTLCLSTSQNCRTPSYTVPDLFVAARDTLADPHCLTSIAYDAQFGFPREIACDNPPGQYDYQHYIKVLDFVPLP